MISRSEGNCPKCGHPVGIDGRCYACTVEDLPHTPQTVDGILDLLALSRKTIADNFPINQFNLEHIPDDRLLSAWTDLEIAWDYLNEQMYEQMDSFGHMTEKHSEDMDEVGRKLKIVQQEVERRGLID